MYDRSFRVTLITLPYGDPYEHFLRGSAATLHTSSPVSSSLPVLLSVSDCYD